MKVFLLLATKTLTVTTTMVATTVLVSLGTLVMAKSVQVGIFTKLSYKVKSRMKLAVTLVPQ